MKKIAVATLLGGAIVGSLLGAGTANADQSWTMPNWSGKTYRALRTPSNR